MNPQHDPAQITRLLREWGGGSHDAFERLVPTVYAELRAIAAQQLNREWRHDRLQITAVVSEAYVRLCQQRRVDWQNRAHFFSIAAQMMRRILTDHARERARLKRGGTAEIVELAQAHSVPCPGADAIDTLDLDRALTKLEAIDADLARIIELRFFGGLTIEETAAALSRSPSTIKREWIVAKAWLFRLLSGDAGV